MQSRLASPVLAGLLVSWLPAQDPDAIADVFPAGSYAYLQFDGLRACVRAAQELGLVELGRSSLEQAPPEVYDELIGRELRRELPRLHGALHRAGVSPATLRAVLQNRLAVGIGRPTFFEGQPVPSVGIAVDVTGCEREAQALVEVLERWALHAGPNVLREQTTVDGTPVTVLRPREAGGAIAIARTGRYLLVTNSRGYLRDCLQACRGERPGFHASAAMRAAAGRLPADPLVFGCVNLGLLSGIAGPFLPYEVTDVCDALGVSSLEGIAFAATTRGNGSLEVLHVALQGPREGLVRSVLGRPASFGAAGLCPPDTLVYATMSLDTREAMAACERVCRALPVEVQRELAREVLPEIERELRHAGIGMRELQGMIGLFGPELTIAMTTPAAAGSLQPELVALVDVADMQAARRLVMEAVHGSGVSDLATTKYGDTTIHYTKAFRSSPLPYSPAFALHGNRLIVGSSVRIVRATLARAAGKREGLDAVEDFRRAAEGARGASMFATVRLNSAVPQLWNLVEPWAEKALWQFGEVDPEVLPNREQLAEAIGDSVMTVTIDGEGLTARDEHVLGLGALIAIAGMAADHVLGAEPAGAPPAVKPKRRIY